MSGSRGPATSGFGNPPASGGGLASNSQRERTHEAVDERRRLRLLLPPAAVRPRREAAIPILLRVRSLRPVWPRRPAAPRLGRPQDLHNQPLELRRLLRGHEAVQHAHLPDGGACGG